MRLLFFFFCNRVSLAHDGGTIGSTARPHPLVRAYCCEGDSNGGVFTASVASWQLVTLSSTCCLHATLHVHCTNGDRECSGTSLSPACNGDKECSRFQININCRPAKYM